MKCLCFLFSLPIDLLNIVLHSETGIYTGVMCLSIGRGLKIFSAVLKGGPKFLHKSEKGDGYHDSHEYHKSDEKLWTSLQRKKGKRNIGRK